MKKIVFILLSIFLSVSYSMAQKKAPVAKFNKTVYDFGKVNEKLGSITTEFSFTNAGKTPLIINRVQTSCGCTTPDYTKAPILPGKKGIIKITYSTVGRVYSFEKRISVFTNNPDTVYTLTIKGEVVK